MSQGMLVAGVRLHRERPIIAWLRRLVEQLGSDDFLTGELWVLHDWGLRGWLAYARSWVRREGWRGYAVDMLGSTTKSIAHLLTMQTLRVIGLSGFLWLLYAMADAITRFYPAHKALNNPLTDATGMINDWFHPEIYAAYHERKAKRYAEIDLRIAALQAATPPYVRAAFTTIFNWNAAYHKSVADKGGDDSA